MSGLDKWLEERERRFNEVTVEISCRCSFKVMAVRAVNPAGEAGAEAHRLMQQHYSESPTCVARSAA